MMVLLDLFVLMGREQVRVSVHLRGIRHSPFINVSCVTTLRFHFASWCGVHILEVGFIPLASWQYRRFLPPCRTLDLMDGARRAGGLTAFCHAMESRVGSAGALVCVLRRLPESR